MSWQEYIDNSLIGSGHVKQAGIFDLSGNVWAASPGLGAQQAQVTALVSGISAGNGGNLPGTGIKVGAVKYMFLRAGDKSVYGKKGAAGICVRKCTKCIIIGVYGEGTQPGAANTTVEGLGDYLENAGY